MLICKRIGDKIDGNNVWAAAEQTATPSTGAPDGSKEEEEKEEASKHVRLEQHHQLSNCYRDTVEMQWPGVMQQHAPFVTVSPHRTPQRYILHKIHRMQAAGRVTV